MARGLVREPLGALDPRRMACAGSFAKRFSPKNPSSCSGHVRAHAPHAASSASPHSGSARPRIRCQRASRGGWPTVRGAESSCRNTSAAAAASGAWMERDGDPWERLGSHPQTLAAARQRLGEALGE